MDFIFGLIIGLLIAILVFSILAFFRAGIEKRVKIIENVLGSIGPKPKGAIFIPDDDSILSRKEIIEKNQKEGKDTNISELM
jgi:hypothetical protein